VRARTVTVFALLLIACAPRSAPSTTGDSASLQAVLVASELPVGEQRVPVGILERNSPVTDATVRLRAYRETPTDPLRVEADAPFKGEGLFGQGVYVARLRFATPGTWTLEVSSRRPTGAFAVTRLPVKVVSRTSVPWIGDRAPASHNLTLRDVADVADIDSGVPPNDMHELSIADAIAQHHPALVVFATPAFCTSAVCGPEVKAVQAMQPAFRDRIVFIHVEIYESYRPDPTQRRLTAAVREWRLQTEPWVFLIDRDGIISAAFEGPAATDELRVAAERMLAAP
jgi:hypothetical protein